MVIQKRLRSFPFDRFNQFNSGAPKTDLRKLIQYHNRVIILANDFKDVYEPILFAQFLISSMQICVIAFQLTLVRIFASD